MTLEVFTHAVDTYINRVLNGDAYHADPQTREKVQLEIKKAVFQPDHIHHSDPSKAPIHIKNGAAIVVGIRESDGYYVPYSSLFRDMVREDMVVPVTYNSNTFVDNEQTKEAGA